MTLRRLSAELTMGLGSAESNDGGTRTRCPPRHAASMCHRRSNTLSGADRSGLSYIYLGGPEVIDLLYTSAGPRFVQNYRTNLMSRPSKRNEQHRVATTTEEQHRDLHEPIESIVQRNGTPYYIDQCRKCGIYAPRENSICRGRNLSLDAFVAATADAEGVVTDGGDAGQ